MTTIAIRGHVMAADSQCTNNGIREGLAKKIAAVNGCLVGSCGDAIDLEPFRAWVAAGRPDGAKPKVADDFSGLVLEADGTYRVYWGDGLGSFVLEAEYHAMGSGRELALGALAMGATAEQAVEAAIKHDVGSFAPIAVLDIMDAEASAPPAPKPRGWRFWRAAA